jgi:hypothetical protein
MTMPLPRLTPDALRGPYSICATSPRPLSHDRLVSPTTSQGSEREAICHSPYAPLAEVSMSARPPGCMLPLSLGARTRWVRRGGLGAAQGQYA